jgi:phosphoglycerate dehydrogenase-like enzyme
MALTVFLTWDARPALRDYLAHGLADRPDINLVYLDSVDAANARPVGTGTAATTPRSDAAALAGLAADADVMIGWRPTRELIDAAPRLRAWINPGAGVQQLIGLFREINAGRAEPIVLVNGHGNAYFVAQHAVALLLALTNRVVPHHGWMAEGLWRKGDADAASIPLRGRTVGLLGYGHINRLVHRFLAGFEVDFAILRREWDAGEEDAEPPAQRFTPEGLGGFLDLVDTLIVALPATAETEGLIDRTALGRLGPRGLVVNVARGGVIVEADLYAALRDRTIMGAALDVWYDYNPAPDAEGRRYPYHLPFHTLDNVVLSPHRAASPQDDLARWDEVIDNLRRIAAGRLDLRNVVDLERGY